MVNINTKTNDFLDALAKLIQDSGLPAVNARMGLDLMRAQLIEVERAAIAQEKRQAEQTKKEEEE